MDAWPCRFARRKAGALARAPRVPRMLGWLCIGLLVAAAAPLRAQSGTALESAIAAARERAGVDPKATRAQLIQLRSQAVSNDRLDLRLGVDEAECRLLSDVDADAAIKVVQAGVAAARGAALGTARAGSVRLALLRLRACGAGMLFEQGGPAGGDAELAAILAESSSDSGLAPARALALLERGLHRSRSADMTRGQEDLLAACPALEQLGLSNDFELCTWHLASHYRRVGDSDEALRLMERLIVSARRRGALVDEGVYAYGIAQARLERGEIVAALGHYRRSLEIALSAGDAVGEIYAENGIGTALVQSGHADEALPHLDRALKLLEDAPDKLQQLRSTIMRATALSALGRAAEAADALARAEPGVRSYSDDALLETWLLPQARALSQLGRWREAFEALSASREIRTRLQIQKQSEQSARLRMQFNREKDASELRALGQTNEQGERLRAAQALAIGLFVALLLVLLVFTVRKIRQGRRHQTMALTDELTGLPNRRAVLASADALLHEARATGGSLSLLMIDVDHFKRVNDTRGHAVGDEVLRHLAQLLSSALRTRDRLGRLGGEEFLVVLPDASVEHAVMIAQRMRQSVEAAPCITSTGELAFTISIGVAAVGEPSETVSSMIARSDAALYAAKASGRNAVSIQGGLAPSPA